ncbi:MAG: Gfo/Idh/MocA family oxidoreductase [Candidatus Scalindua sp.]|jgi:predicted dehydrogenase|nr:Gfo/Idh/MocA family oxidoreductase [Candidatus Scalindua sp.]
MNILIVGLGSIGSVHAINANKYSNISVADNDKAKADTFAKRHECVSYGDDLEEAFSHKFDGIIIATPNKQHIEIATKAIKSGADVLIEKPISHSVKDVQNFLDYAKKINRKVYVVCNMRFHPAVKILHNNLYKIGKPYFARAHFGNYLPNMRVGVDYRQLYVADKDEGGVALDAIHELDYLSWMFGTAESIVSDSGRISELQIDAEDYASILTRHESGVRSEVHLDYIRQVKLRGCEISGSEGLLDWNSEGKSPEFCKIRIYTKSKGWETLLETKNLDSGSSMKELTKEFIVALQGRDNILQTGDEALILLKNTLKVRKHD